MHPMLKIRKTAVAIAVGATLILGACGGGDGTEPAVADQVLSAIQALPSVREVAFVYPEPAACPTTSHPFSTMLCSVGVDYDQTGSKPIDIKKDYGYTEKEFFQSGKANVYDLGADERAVVSSSGHSYATRLLVRYPSDPAKFSGRVFIDILNASSGVDLEDTWRRSWNHMMLSGDAYVGITSKSLTADALKKFDPTRYADINWQVDGKNEDGLFWDMLSQLGTQLRKPGTGGILGSLKPQFVYLGGQSQSGFYMNTYLTAFTDRLEKAGPDGKPLFDGYLNLVGPGSMPLRSESGVPSVSVPKKLYQVTSVPQIVLMSEAESRFAGGGGGGDFPVFPPYSRRADANSATDKFRFYEVAGAPHADPTSPIIPINTEIAKAKADGTGRAPKAYFTGHEEPALHLDDFVTGALENLHAWAAKGIPAPAAQSNWMWYSITKDAKGNDVYDPLRDQLGNALGGLRSPLIDVPLYQYLGMGKTATGGTALDWGSMIRFPDTTINVLYDGSCTKYLARFNAAADALLSGAYIVKHDADKVKTLGARLASQPSEINPAVSWATTPCN
ncbi:alpha/beta hydrolase domain-containing protein [Rhodoferax sp.]|uniref:alpha/beta hydrolase domain-containing protein n=1 Tax=Rhodoferax sp. TaxID=50421 RepID=UPI0026295ACB|nr:alpha/beta hydrolase domain-containing protein [Rhodoferax sp.]MDD3935351.1 alpha/beta hydrolase domain-containing protein [Rhodoferax sp.]